MNAKNSSCCSIYMKKCATADAIFSKKRNTEKINPEQSRKVLEPLKLKIYKAMPRTENDILIRYCWWIHVEKRERRVIGGEEQDLNAGNSTNRADKSISDYAANELITTAINDGDSTDFTDDAAGEVIMDINADN